MNEQENGVMRRALMGDREAQKECTRQGIVLPCPKCYGKVKANIVRADRVCIEMEYKCQKCGLTVKYTQFFPLDECAAMCATALERWNRRPAPPIGRCKDCKHLGERVVHETGQKENFCNHDQYGLFAFDSTEAYCSYFELKEENT